MLPYQRGQATCKRKNSLWMKFMLLHLQGLLAFYGLPPPHTLVQGTAQAPSSLPDGVQFEMHTLPVRI